MRIRALVPITALLLFTAACSGATVTATTSTASTTTTTTLIPPVDSSAATSDAASTTTQTAATTTTTAAAEETTTTQIVATTTTTEPEIDPDLVDRAGLFRQPTTYTGFLDFQANGIIRAGNRYDALEIVGRWDYDAANDEFNFWDFDFGDGCNGTQGRYARETAPGGGRRILLVEDPCEDRVNFITQPGSTCRCFLYLAVELPDEG